MRDVTGMARSRTKGCFMLGDVGQWRNNRGCGNQDR
jgi:hypothetical protein